MTRYIIKRQDPILIKNDIIKYWYEYLPGTPETRFDWLLSGNPAGKTLWYAAYSEAEYELVGTLSITPKSFYYHGEKIKGGILGDFMVKKEHRVFGPALLLIKAAMDRMKIEGFYFLYTIPNVNSMQLIKHAGMTNRRQIKCIGLPINYRYYLAKRLPSLAIGIASYILDKVIRLYCGEYFIRNFGIFKEVKSIDKQFVTLCKKRKRINAFTGDNRSTYIEWRYFNNPSGDFYIYSYRYSQKEELSGYVIFQMKHQKIEIYDIFALKKKDILNLTKSLIQLGRKSNLQAIYFHVPTDSDVERYIKRLLPFDMKNSYEVLAVSANEIDLYSEWDFLPCDRNL